MTPEGRVKNAVKEWLRERKCWYYMPVQNGMGVTGIPDFICCHKGRFFAIETKAPGKLSNVSAMQEVQINGIRKAGGLAWVVDNPDQLESVAKWMLEIERPSDANAREQT